MILALLIVTQSSVLNAVGEEAPKPVMQVKLVLSDSEVCTQDGLAYKVILTNTSRSLIPISGPTFVPRFSCVIELKEGGGEWREIWNYPMGIKTTIPGPIQIAAGSTWAEYGQVFLTNKDGKFPTTGKSYVFGKAGKLELRARIKSAIGSYVSDPVPLTVRARPKGEEHLDKRYEPFGRMVLDQNTIASHLHAEDFDSLYKRHPSGGVGKTLKMMLAVHRYVESGEVAGKAATWSEAFKALSVGLDEVRHDQLAFILSYGAMKDKQWKDLEFFVEQMDDGAYRTSMRGQLESAILTGKYRAP